MKKAACTISVLSASMRKQFMQRKKEKHINILSNPLPTRFAMTEMLFLLHCKMYITYKKTILQIIRYQLTWLLSLHWPVWCALNTAA